MPDRLSSRSEFSVRPRYFLGLDFGTSGARAIAINDREEIQASASVRFDRPETRWDWFGIWRAALDDLLAQLDRDLRANLAAIAIDGTSSTVFLTDDRGQPVSEPLLYNDDRARSVLDRVAAIAPDNHPTRSATSSLAKLFWLLDGVSTANDSDIAGAGHIFCHQADWLAAQLHGHLAVSDYNNALKFGYDPGAEIYPAWLLSGLRESWPNWTISVGDAAAHATTPRLVLPRVIAPGTPIAPVTPTTAQRYGLPNDCQVIAGTTDSIASFLASGRSQPGEAVTALGSTLAVKLLSRTRIDDARYGIYSHRLGDLWLVGGASNTGGAVLREFFSDRELIDLSATILETNGASPSPLDYYPLLRPGERFPENDPALAPRLTPRPDDRAAFLHGLLDGMARIETRGYALLSELGADRLIEVETTGGGARNPLWQALRSQRLGISVRPSPIVDAAYGVARLAARVFE